MCPNLQTHSRNIRLTDSVERQGLKNQALPSTQVQIQRGIATTSLIFSSMIKFHNKSAYKMSLESHTQLLTPEWPGLSAQKLSKFNINRSFASTSDILPSNILCQGFNSCYAMTGNFHDTMRIKASIMLCDDLAIFMVK